MLILLSPDKPGSPLNLRVTDTNKSHISLEWDAPDNDGGTPITNYIVESRSDMDTGYVPIAKLDGLLTKYTARKLLEGTDYNFRIKARNLAGVSDQGVALDKPVTAKLPFGELSFCSLSVYMKYHLYDLDTTIFLWTSTF